MYGRMNSEVPYENVTHIDLMPILRKLVVPKAILSSALVGYSAYVSTGNIELSSAEAIAAGIISYKSSGIALKYLEGKNMKDIATDILNLPKRLPEIIH